MYLLSKTLLPIYLLTTYLFTISISYTLSTIILIPIPILYTISISTLLISITIHSMHYTLVSIRVRSTVGTEYEVYER